MSEEDNAMLLPITDLLKKITNWDDETEFEEEFPNVSSLFWKPVKSLTPKVIWTHCSFESHILGFLVGANLVEFSIDHKWDCVKQ